MSSFYLVHKNNITKRGPRARSKSVGITRPAFDSVANIERIDGSRDTAWSNQIRIVVNKVLRTTGVLHPELRFNAPTREIGPAKPRVTAR